MKTKTFAVLLADRFGGFTQVGHTSDIKNNFTDNSVCLFQNVETKEIRRRNGEIYKPKK